jgi:formate hydrogenlyase subunit 4
MIRVSTDMALLRLAATLVLAPLLFGVITRTQALFAGRKGQPLLQMYFDIAKLMRKGAAISRTTTWVFRLGPIVGLSCVATGCLLLPFAGFPALVSFPGDFVVLTALLALMRFVTVSAALDTGSSFEGMGASRDVQFSALAEPALLVSFAVLARQTSALSMSDMFGQVSAIFWHQAAPSFVLAALFIVFLAENARIPFDDPNTHLELTMVHEVMVLDHGGPDLGFILYGSALKMWILGALIVNIVIPIHAVSAWPDIFLFIIGMLLLAVAVGVVESVMARLRLLHVPQLLVGALGLAILALMLMLGA